MAGGILAVMKLYEVKLGKPALTWTSEERIAAHDYTANFFNGLATQIQRSPGRPRKKRRGGGLINSLLNPDALRGADRKQRSNERAGQRQARAHKKAEMAGLLQEAVAFLDGVKLGHAANQQYLDLRRSHGEDSANDLTNSPENFLHYLDRAMDRDDSDHPLNKRLPPGALRLLQQEFGLRPGQMTAIKMRVSRARKHQRPS